MPAKVSIIEAPAPDRSGYHRVAAVDCLRGAALVGMIIYHLAWDLHAFGLSPVDPGASSGWRLFGHGVATLFLGLSGFGIALAGRRDLKLSRAILRLGIIAAAAMAVTVATIYAAPGATVWFGILHCIFVTNVVALALRQCSNAVMITIGALAAAVPWVLPPAFGGVAWAWTGLSATQPATLDFRPVLPWLAPVLFGMVAGRTRLVDWLNSFSRGSAIRRSLATGGRHTLLVYLLHQPLLIGLLVAIYGSSETRFGPGLVLAEPKQAGDFLRTCKTACVAKGRDEAICTAMCHCVLTATLAHPTPSHIPAASALDVLRQPLASCQPNP